MSESLRVLIVEDCEDDARLVLRELRRSGYEPVSERVGSDAAMRKALADKRWELILSDYVIPGFGGLEALRIAKASGLDLPFILVSNKVGEETLVEAMRAGATDFIMKDRLSRLGPVVKRELADAVARHTVRRAQEAELEQFKLAETFFNHSLSSLVILDRNFNFIRVNEAYARACRKDIGEFAGRNHFEMYPSDAKAIFEDVIRTKRLYETFTRAFVYPDQPERGMTYWDWTLVPVLGRSGEVEYLVFSLNEVTERKRAEEAVAASEKKYRDLVETVSDWVWEVDDKGAYTYCSPRVRNLLGYEVQELIGKSPFDLMPAAEAARMAAIFGALVAERRPLAALENVNLRKDGREVVLETNGVPVFDSGGVFKGYRGIDRDITERRRAEQALRESEETLRTVTLSAQDAILMLDNDGNIALWNAAAEKIFGYSSEEALGKDMHLLLAPARFHEAQRAAFLRFRSTGEGAVIGKTLELAALRKDGAEFPIELSVSAVTLKDKWHAVGIVRDITTRKQSELALERANRALRTLGACNEALVRAANESELLDSICRLVVEIGGYRMAWIGIPEQDSAKTVRAVAQYGHEEGYLAAAKISWADTERGHGPTGTAIRTGAVQVNRDFLTDPAMAPWREATRQRSYRSSIALPLKSSAGILGVLTIYATEPNAFKEDEVTLLKELAEDLTYGIETLRTRTDRDRIANEHLHHAELLKQSLEDSIKAIADTVEMRDPYTAGHQRRVGELAVAISKELGLAEETIHGIELAASIHDLGKISVPAEILAKPAKLTDIEFMLVRNHVQAGYDILKDIKFPWPIATMVWQHHERLDGSGYPQGLKGDEILLESRIMAVADVVEAMASHRPYRAALGIDVAVKEIERGRGTAYDPAVVDACVRLFKEKRIALTT